MSKSVLWVCPMDGCTATDVLDTKDFDGASGGFAFPCTHPALPHSIAAQTVRTASDEAAKGDGYDQVSAIGDAAWYGFRFATSDGMFPGEGHFRAEWSKRAAKPEAGPRKSDDEMIAAFGKLLRERIDVAPIQVISGGDGFV